MTIVSHFCFKSAQLATKKSRHLKGQQGLGGVANQKNEKKRKRKKPMLPRGMPWSVFGGKKKKKNKRKKNKLAPSGRGRS